MVVNLTTSFSVKMNKNNIFLLLGLSFLLVNVVQVSGSESKVSEVNKNGGSVIEIAQLELEHEEDAEIVPKVVSKEERDDGDYPEYPIDTEEILGIGKTLFIVVAVIIIVIVVGVPVVCCIICGCMCFRRNKKSNTTIVVPPYQQPQGQHPNQGQVQIQTNNFQNPQPYPQQYVQQTPYTNNGYNFDNNVDAQGKRYDDGYGPYNGNQKSASPPRQLGQQVGPNRYDQMGQYPGDPNLIPNRFKPSVPAKPGRVPGWTAVAAEVKVRNKLVMDQQNSHYIPPAPISPDSNMHKTQRDFVRSTSNNSNPNPNQIQNSNPPHPHTHPQGYTNEAYDGGLTSLPQSPVPYPYPQSTNPNQGYNPNNPTNYGSPPAQGGYNGHSDNFMY